MRHHLISVSFSLSLVATLDWILHDESLEPTKHCPVPDLDKTKADHFALPSPSFPSDHVSLVADLAWRASRGATPE